MGKTGFYCPNCNGPATRENDEITCEACDAVFTVRQKEVKVKQLGKIDDLEKRIGRLESLLPGGEPAKEKPAAAADDPERLLEENGFIV